MTHLYRRILLWHKLIAQQTGGIALCAAKHKLNRDEARGWSTMFRNVADEIDAFLRDGSFLLDERGQRVFPSGADGARQQKQEAEHENVASLGSVEGIQTQAASPPKRTGGLRVATRKPT